jgi:hypothetical protein
VLVVAGWALVIRSLVLVVSEDGDIRATGASGKSRDARRKLGKGAWSGEEGGGAEMWPLRRQPTSPASLGTDLCRATAAVDGNALLLRSEMALSIFSWALFDNYSRDIKGFLLGRMIDNLGKAVAGTEGSFVTTSLRISRSWTEPT